MRIVATDARTNRGKCCIAATQRTKKDVPIACSLVCSTMRPSSRRGRVTYAGYEPRTLSHGSLQARHLIACATGGSSMLPSTSMKKT